MTQSKSFKLTKRIQPATDNQREKLLRRLRNAYILGGSVFIFIGIYKILEKFAPDFSFLTDQSLLKAGILIAILVIFTYHLVVRVISARYDLRPKDEYEQSLIKSRYAKSYDFLTFAILFIIILGFNDTLFPFVGLLLVAFGIAMILDSKVSGYGPK